MRDVVTTTGPRILVESIIGADLPHGHTACGAGGMAVELIIGHLEEEPELN
jgi:hypothetical protein